MRNFRQRRCRYCGKHGGDFGRHLGECLPAEELAAIRAFAKANGRTWRAKLSAAWTAGSEEFRVLRNMVGPGGLHRIRP